MERTDESNRLELDSLRGGNHGSETWNFKHCWVFVFLFWLTVATPWICGHFVVLGELLEGNPAMDVEFVVRENLWDGISR